MIWLAVAGLAFGLFAGPLLFYSVGVLVLKLRGARQSKDIQKVQKEHNASIQKMKKEYEGDRKLFNKKTRKMQKILAKAKGG